MPSLARLDPRFRGPAKRFFAYARRLYPGLVVTSARRSYKEQLHLYQRYLAGQNDGLPAVPPGTSDHELGMAFDMARLNVDPLKDPALVELGKVWMRWGYRWWAGDPVHFAAPLKWLQRR